MVKNWMYIEQASREDSLEWLEMNTVMYLDQSIGLLLLFDDWFITNRARISSGLIDLLSQKDRRLF